MWRPPRCSGPVAQQRGPFPGQQSVPSSRPRVCAFLRVPLLSGASALLLCESNLGAPVRPSSARRLVAPQRSAAECSACVAGHFGFTPQPAFQRSEPACALRALVRPSPLRSNCASRPVTGSPLRNLAATDPCSSSQPSCTGDPRPKQRCLRCAPAVRSRGRAISPLRPANLVRVSTSHRPTNSRKTRPRGSNSPSPSPAGPAFLRPTNHSANHKPLCPHVPCIPGRRHLPPPGEGINSKARTGSGFVRA